VLDDELDANLRDTLNRRRLADAAAAAAGAATKRFVFRALGRGLTMRDVGALLNVSHQ
jgi:hypothetical protein